MDKALTNEATTKEELEVMVDIYYSFIDAVFYIFLVFKPLSPKQHFSLKILFLKGFYFYFHESLFFLVLFIINSINNIHNRQTKILSHHNNAGGGALNQGETEGADREEAELDDMDKALTDEATTKEELEVMVNIYYSFIDTVFYIFLVFKPLSPKQHFSLKILFLKGFYFYFHASLFWLVLFIINSIKNIHNIHIIHNIFNH